MRILARIMTSRTKGTNYSKNQQSVTQVNTKYDERRECAVDSRIQLRINVRLGIAGGHAKNHRGNRNCLCVVLCSGKDDAAPNDNKCHKMEQKEAAAKS